MQKICEDLDGIDCLINNAGVWLQGPLDETDNDRIQETIDINVNGTISLTKAAMPQMKRQKSGLIINVVSQGGLNAREGWPIYTASKWAITGFTKAMQQELEPFGIGVTGLYPPTLNTEMFAKSGVTKDVSHALDPADVAKIVEFIVSMDGALLLTEIGIRKPPTSK
jgi:short-subunit dehydrogenase